MDSIDVVDLFLKLLAAIVIGYGLYSVMTEKQSMKQKVGKLIRTMGPRELAAFRALLVAPEQPENSPERRRLYVTYGKEYVTRAEQRFVALTAGEDITLEELRLIAQKLLRLPGPETAAEKKRKDS